jgi:alpha-beta hydrolase superfamily lysophospholipase
MAAREELTIQAGDAHLAGTLSLPDDPPPPDRGGRYPGVLLLPSWLPRDRDGAYDHVGHATWFAAADPGQTGLLARLADALARRGVASLRCDPRGCRASDGAWEEVDLFTRIDDARDMVAAMRSQGRIDLRRTGIIGHGEGAALAVSVAISDPAIGALTLIGAGARSYRDLLRRSVAARARAADASPHPIVAAIDRWSEEIIEAAERREAETTVWLTRGSSVRLALAGVEQAIHTPTRALVTMLHRSVTLVHGERDVWSQPDEAELLAEALGEAGTAPEMRLVPGAGHDLAEAPDAVIDEIAADVAARLLPRDLPPVLLAIEEMDATR